MPLEVSRREGWEIDGWELPERREFLTNNENEY